MAAIANQTTHFDLGHGLTAEHAFSSKPDGGYRDYHHKMTTYASIIAGPAAVLDATATPRPYRALDKEDADSVFNYVETASDRVGIGALTAKLAGHRIAIIGLGGSGSYILDMVARRRWRRSASSMPTSPPAQCFQGTRRAEPRRTPRGAARGGPLQGDLRAHASRHHRGASRDRAGQSRPARRHRLRVPEPRAQARPRRRWSSGSTREACSSTSAWGWSCATEGADEILGVDNQRRRRGKPSRRVIRSARRRRCRQHLRRRELQVADLNALNAVFAVIEWKKLCGFYCDLENSIIRPIRSTGTCC
ncbi:DUF6791 domain-containing protein [Sphingomonas sp. MMS24-JH45]